MQNNIEKPWAHGALAVGPSRRTLQNGDRPFFWLADTAWLLFKNLTLEESRCYLQDRRQKGFNVIQAMVLHDLPHTNHGGRAPFLDGDMARPDLEGEDGYWGHIDRVVFMAEALGLYMALVPSWGSNVDRGLLTEGNVRAYTAFLAGRYGDRPNIIWLVGGDTIGGRHAALWDAMGRTLKAKCPGQLVTFHPFGATSSSQWFHGSDWLDFNMFQSGHSTYAQAEARREEFVRDGRMLYGEDNWRYVQNDLSLRPPKPTVDGEPCYELILTGLHGDNTDYWMPPDIRRFAYWSVFAGAMGFTYGHSAVMQFYAGGKSAYKNATPWQQALHHPAAGQMRHLRALMESLPFTQGAAAQHLLAVPEGERCERISVFAGEGWLLAHTATGRPIALAPDLFGGGPVEANWFDPVSGAFGYVGRYGGGVLPTFTPPERFDGSADWVLMLSAGRSYRNTQCPAIGEGSHAVYPWDRSEHPEHQGGPV